MFYYKLSALIIPIFAINRYFCALKLLMVKFHRLGMSNLRVMITIVILCIALFLVIVVF